MCQVNSQNLQNWSAHFCNLNFHIENLKKKISEENCDTRWLKHTTLSLLPVKTRVLKAIFLFPKQNCKFETKCRSYTIEPMIPMLLYLFKKCSPPVKVSDFATFISLCWISFYHRETISKLHPQTLWVHHTNTS